MTAPYAIYWFRRDLRLVGNVLLLESLRKYQGRVLCFFCFDPVFLARADFSVDRFQFFLQTLQQLKIDLQQLGGDLLVLDSGPFSVFPKLLDACYKNKHVYPHAVFFNRDYEPFARSRDQKVTQLFSEYGVEVQTGKDHLFIEPEALLNFAQKEAPYRVFSRFFVVWRKMLLAESCLAQEIAYQKKSLKKYESEKGLLSSKKIFMLIWKDIIPVASQHENVFLSDKLDHYLYENQNHVRIKIPPAGFHQAIKALSHFNASISHYKTQRDIPSISATSQLSIFFKNGSLTVAQAVAYLGLDHAVLEENQEKYLAELAWREFYYHILYFFPDVEKNEFQEKYRGLQWENNPIYFERWKNGETGFPIVDAGMRHLNTTGWMHNRVRMIVASFLVKDLLVDWRLGEQYFMSRLLDGDLACNNGGWQWCASTGVDAQPYFRIFNPMSQAKKFDSGGVYVKRYIPELSGLSESDVHDLTVTSKVEGYHAPMISHDEQRKKTLALFKGVKSLKV